MSSALRGHDVPLAKAVTLPLPAGFRPRNEPKGSELPRGDRVVDVRELDDFRLVWGRPMGRWSFEEVWAFLGQGDRALRASRAERRCWRCRAGSSRVVELS